MGGHLKACNTKTLKNQQAVVTTVVTTAVTTRTTAARTTASLKETVGRDVEDKASWSQLKEWAQAARDDSRAWTFKRAHPPVIRCVLASSTILSPTCRMDCSDDTAHVRAETCNHLNKGCHHMNLKS